MPKLKKKADKCQRVSVPDAAKEIGCDADYLRQKMKRKEWDLGVAVSPARAGGNYTYYVFRAKLDKFLGLDRESEETESIVTWKKNK